MDVCVSIDSNTKNTDAVYMVLENSGNSFI